MREVLVYQDVESMVQAAIENALETISKHDQPKVALSGGSTGVAVGAGLIRSLSKDQLQSVKFFMADERFLPIEDAQSNWGQIRALIGDLKPNIYLFELPPAKALLASVASANFELGEDFSFDLALLGCGPDGHTASLFPAHQYPEQTVVAELNSPKPPSERISFGYRVFQKTSEVFFIASGAEKATAVSQGLIGNIDLPVGRITGMNTTKWFITEELA